MADIFDFAALVTALGVIVIGIGLVLYSSELVSTTLPFIKTVKPYSPAFVGVIEA